MSSKSSNPEWFEVGCLSLHHNAGGLGLQPFPSQTLVTWTSRKTLDVESKIPWKWMTTQKVVDHLTAGIEEEEGGEELGEKENND